MTIIPLAEPEAASPAERLRAAILHGDFAPGQRLVEADLCEQFGASRSQVRSALIELTHEGLIERIANRGARVRVVSLAEAVELTEVRAVVEGLCAAKAAERATAEQCEELRAIGGGMREALARGEVLAYADLNVSLHALVQAIAAQSVADEVLARLQARNVRNQFRLSLQPGRPQVSLPEHLAIIEAICAKDPGAAERAMRTHVESVIAALQAAGAAGPQRR